MNGYDFDKKRDARKFERLSKFSNHLDTSVLDTLNHYTVQHDFSIGTDIFSAENYIIC